MSPLRARALLFVGLGGIAACVGVSGLSGPAEGPGGGDASTDSTASSGDSAIAADGGNGQDSRAPTGFCAKIVPPPAPNDFFCDDFDETDGGLSWPTSATSDGGVIGLTQNPFRSPPNGLSAVAPRGAGDRGGWVEWSKTGSSNVRQVDVQLALDPKPLAGPSSSPNSELAFVTVKLGTNLEVSFARARGGPFADGGAWAGYYVRTLYSGGPAFKRYDVVPTALVDDTWTYVRLTLDSGGTVKVAYNEVQVYSGPIVAFAEPSVRVLVGAMAIGNLSVADEMRFDDVVVTVAR